MYRDYATRAQVDLYHYQVQIDNLGSTKYQLVGGFSAKFVSSRTSQNIPVFFDMIGNKSFHFIFSRGGRFQNWSLPLNLLNLKRRLSSGKR